MNTWIALSCHTLMDEFGTLRAADLRYSLNHWTRFEVRHSLNGPYDDDFIVPGLPVEFHCHSIGPYDFTSMTSCNLRDINYLAKAEGILCIPHCFCPITGSITMVLSPDILLDNSTLRSAYPSLEWIFELLIEAGIQPAFGHFVKQQPVQSTEYVRTLLKVAERLVDKVSKHPFLTDHLFNDMPRHFHHAWRTPQEKAQRTNDLKNMHIDNWNWDNLDEVLGEVPAILLRAAREGYLLICLNFDGDHIDLEICRRIVQLLGPDRIIAMTDRTDCNQLGDQKLESHYGNSLRYQNESVLAAGSQSIDQQIHNMRDISLSEEQIWKMTCFVPSRVLNIPLETCTNNPPEACSYVSKSGERFPIYSR